MTDVQKIKFLTHTNKAIYTSFEDVEAFEEACRHAECILSTGKRQENGEEIQKVRFQWGKRDVTITA